MKWFFTFFLIQFFGFFSLAKDLASNLNLYDLHYAETLKLNPEQVTELNHQSISDLETIKFETRDQFPDRRKARVSAITPDTAQLIIDSIDKNPVTTIQSYAKYNQPGIDLGFCFGRATYVHLLLLKMGVEKHSIKKVWLIGPMKAGSVDWGFHVATAVKATTGEWLVIDSVPGKLLNIRDWVTHFVPSNQEQKNLRVYTSEPTRFGTGPGLYTRASFGLDYDQQQDWYRHYFLDLMRWFQKTELSTLGLSDLRSNFQSDVRSSP